MENGSSLNRWSGLTGQTLNPMAEDSDIEQGNSVTQKETPRASHDSKRQEERVLPETEEVPWEDDPANAHNWSTSSRIFHSMVPCKKICLAS